MSKELKSKFDELWGWAVQMCDHKDDCTECREGFKFRYSEFFEHVDRITAQITTLKQQLAAQCEATRGGLEGAVVIEGNSREVVMDFDNDTCTYKPAAKTGGEGGGG